MSKIGCNCGHVIVDQTDYIPYKAGYIPDTVSCDLVEVVSDEIIEKVKEAGIENILNEDIADILWSRIFYQNSKQIYECEKCGSILIEKIEEDNVFHKFKPDFCGNEEKQIRTIYTTKRVRK
ncbi:hypothetical protein [Zooshikella ganghwensis]|uniref:hypothetical protein n=1 Tax=Zooshikella ganghwensis TaxID=202772 RepID=UPI0004832C37|nr:hypothetical protein [Zooshikella ganghwensis]